MNNDTNNNIVDNTENITNNSAIDNNNLTASANIVEVNTGNDSSLKIEENIETPTPKKKTSFMTIVTRIVLLIIIIFLLFIFFTKDGKNIVYRNLSFKEIKVSTLSPNKYYKDYSYEYVQITNDFYAKDKQHLLNIYYTIANSGAKEFTFACSKEYESCLDDVKEISKDEVILSNIKAFVHPFNGFSRIETNYSNHGEVVLNIEYTYSESEIKEIELIMNTVISSQKINTNDIKSIIKTYHDYIINNTKYDSERSQDQVVNYRSETAYGSLIQGFALCEGYTDAMALFLNYYNIPNYKVISKAHIWNAVYLDNKWYHLDLTWDDPITTSGRDVLRYSYFLITTNDLLTLEKTEHIFDQYVFSEVLK